MTASATAFTHFDWGQYGDLQRGDYAKARTWIERLEAITAESDGGRGPSSISMVKARYTVETEEWNVQPITADSPAHELLATALSAARTGDLPTVQLAEAALQKLTEGAGSGRRGGGRGFGGNTTQIMHKQVSALVHVGMGQADDAIRLMDEAAALKVAMRPPNGTASPIKPVHELYGEMLLELDRPADAIAKFGNLAAEAAQPAAVVTGPGTGLRQDRESRPGRAVLRPTRRRLAGS